MLNVRTGIGDDGAAITWLAPLLVPLAACVSTARPATSFPQPQSAPAPVHLAAHPSLTLDEQLSGVIWRFRAGAPVAGALAVTATGVYVGTTDGSLHALALDGSYRWNYSVNGAITAGPVLDARGGVYVGTATGFVYAVRNTGTPLWSARVPIAPESELALGPLGHLYFEAGGALYVLSRQGALLSRHGLRKPSAPMTLAAPSARDFVAIPGHVNAFALSSSGTVFVASDRGELWRVSADKKLGRSLHIAEAAITKLVLTADESQVIAAAGDGTVIALRADLGGTR